MWQRSGILIVTAAVFGALGAYVFFGKDGPRRTAASEAPQIGSHRDLVKAQRGASDKDVPPPSRNQLECANRFTEKRGATKSGFDAGSETKQQRIARVTARRMQLKRMPMRELTQHATDDELFWEVYRRVDGGGRDSKVREQLWLYVTLQAEVGNGGFHQYFHNSSGDRAMQTLEALRGLKLSRATEIFECALTAFPNGVASADFVDRYAALEAFGDAELDIFHALDEAFYANEGTTQREVAQFIRANASQLDLPPL